MSSETGSAFALRSDSAPMLWGGISGGLAGVVMGALMLMQMRPVLEMAIPAMYGIAGPALTVGFLLHVLHGVVFGLLFAALVSLPPLRERAGSIGAGAALGVGYGVLVWLVAAAVVMPVWLSAAGFAGAPGVPNFNPTSLIGHAVFGLVLGVAYPVLVTR